MPSRARFRFSRVRAVAAAVLVLAAAPTAGVSQSPSPDAGPIRWVDDPAEALEISRRTGRKVIAYVSSDRCGYCRKMDRETWTDPGIARVVAEQYVPLRLSAARHRSQVRSLRVRAFPTTVVLSSAGQGLTGAAGFLPPEKLAELLADRPEPTAVASRAGAFGL